MVDSRRIRSPGERDGWRYSWLAIIVIALATPLYAQSVVDPTTAEFDPSSDHSAVVDGQPLVDRYDLRIYRLDENVPYRVVDLQKPAPGTDGKIRVNLVTLLTPPLPAGVAYTADVAAVGPGGLNASPLSVDLFSFSGPPLSVTTLSANVAFPVAVGTPVTWTAASTGGSSPYSYRFWVLYGSTWSVGREWSASNSWTWTPTITGTYQVQVWARNAGSSVDFDAWRDSGPVGVAAPPPLGVTAVSANPPGPVWTNTPVTWTAVASGGTAPYSYKFWVFNGTSWSIGRDWGASNSWTWTPSVAGNYEIQVWVRNAGSSANYDAWLASTPYVVNGPQALSVRSLTANQVFPIPQGTPVNWTVTASGGTGPYSYKFWVHNGTTWTVARDWGSSKTFAWAPSAQGTYTIQVWARNAGSSSDFDGWRGFGPYSVMTSAPLTATSLLADRLFPLATGTPVQWTALARGGTGPYTYKFWVYSGSSWMVGQDWSALPTWTWIPPAAGVYQFQVWIRNAGSASSFDGWLGAGPVSIGVAAP
jgi:hypothetical protein